MSYTYYRVSGFNRAVVQTLSAGKTATSSTDTLTCNGHGMAVGDNLAFSNVNGLSTIAVSTRYWVVAATTNTFQISATKGGSPISVGTGSGLVFNYLVETRLYLAQKATANAETSDITWEGDDQKIKKSSLDGVTYTLDLDAVPASAHAAIFGHTGVGVTLPGGITNAYGYGGGNDNGGVACGIRLEADGVKDVDGVLTSVSFARWAPKAVVTLLKPGDIQTSAKAGQTQYSFSAERTTTDLLGLAIPNASTSGDFWFDGDIA